ncbi:hypothetical protein V6S06_14000 [Aeromonas hydrophila]|nr:hypothetical protein [Aeromonas hydrophila]
MKKVLPLLFSLPCFSYAVESDWSIDKNNCVAYSKETVSDGGAFFMAASVTESGNLRGMILYASANDVKPLDGAQVIPTNGRDIRYAVTTPTPKAITFEPQTPDDTMFLLKSSTTGSVNFNKVMLRTAGAKSTIDYLFANCK